MRALFRSALLLSATALATTWSLPAQADQLQCLSASDANKATTKLQPGTVFIDFCSLCQNPASLVRVTAVKTVADCQTEVEVTGEVIAQTTESFSDGFKPDAAKWVATSAQFSQRIDLAYAYIQSAPNMWTVLGTEIGLAPTVNTTRISLPAAIYTGAGLGEAPAGSDLNAPTPTPDAIMQVYKYQTGKGSPDPVLVKLEPCLTVDTKKGSETRYDCTEPVTGPVKKGAKVNAWMWWAMPKGQTNDDVTVQFLHNGMVRQTTDVSLKVASLRSRTFRSVRATKRGEWEIVVRVGSAVVGKSTFTVE